MRDKRKWNERADESIKTCLSGFLSAIVTITDHFRNVDEKSSWIRCGTKQKRRV
jgi:hypothetical protein